MEVYTDHGRIHKSFHCIEIRRLFGGGNEQQRPSIASNVPDCGKITQTLLICFLHLVTGLTKASTF
jgi:hypothetical protein